MYQKQSVRVKPNIKAFIQDSRATFLLAPYSDYWSHKMLGIGVVYDRFHLVVKVI